MGTLTCIPHDAQRPIYTHARFLPGSEIHDTSLLNVLLADGCRINNATVLDSVVGLRSIIGPEANIKNSIIMGADYYETDGDKEENRRRNIPDIGIGAHSIIRAAIIDKTIPYFISGSCPVSIDPDANDSVHQTGGVHRSSLLPWWQNRYPR